MVPRRRTTTGTTAALSEAMRIIKTSSPALGLHMNNQNGTFFFYFCFFCLCLFMQLHSFVLRTFVISVLVLVSAVFVVTATETNERKTTKKEDTVEATEVIKLTKKNFVRTVIKPHKMTLVHFGIPTHVDSNYIIPVMEVVATALRGISQVGFVNCEEEPEICQYFR
jgi:hypothetical protein